VRRMEARERHLLLRALGATLVFLVLALGAGAQADYGPLQTVPTPTPPEVPTPDAGETPRPPGEAGSGTRDALALRVAVQPQDVLPGEELEFRVWMTNTSTTAITGIAVTDPLHPTLELLEVSATQGVAEVKGHALTLYVGTLEAGQKALILIRARVGPDVQPGQILLNQATAHYEGGQVRSNVAAAGLPPIELPPTGQDRRTP